MLFYHVKHTKHMLKYHLVTAEPPFTVKMINCMHQSGPRKGAYHRAVCYPQAWCYQVCHCVGRCVKNGSCSSSIEWKSVDCTAGISYYLNECQMLLMRIVNDNFVFQQDRAPVHLAFNTVQLLQCKTLNFLSPQLWPRNRSDLNSINYQALGRDALTRHCARVRARSHYARIGARPLSVNERLKVICNGFSQNWWKSSF